MLIPVLPPMAASTIPATEVGTLTQLTPRNQEAAAKPAKSVVAPPPIPMIQSVREKLCSDKVFQISIRTSALFCDSPSGSSIVINSTDKSHSAEI